MNYLYDTNIIIAFLKNESKIVDLFSGSSVINISPVTVGEMYYGARNSQNSLKNLEIYKDFFSYCNVLSISFKTAIHYSDLKIKLKEAGKPIPENDLWIAANAIENSLTIVTRDKHLLGIDFVSTFAI
jgi:tRNA(fMet)-specific endonuclease VapC